MLDQVAGTHEVDHRLGALHVDFTYLVNEHTSCVVTPTVVQSMPSTTVHNDNHPLSQKLDPRLGLFIDFI